MTALLRQFDLTKGQVDAVRAFILAAPKERLRMSAQIVSSTIVNPSGEPDVRFAAAVDESQSLLNGYSTLDEPHRADIGRLIRHMTSYIRDPTRKRPFNALMLAAPGAGKSHFINQLAAAMKGDRVQAVTFNMATMQSASDMAHPIDLLRNVKVNDGFPLLFLDEFDSDPSRYATLLPLLWDGEMHIGHRDLKLGKAVIVLAGSNPDLPKAMTQSATMRAGAEVRGETVVAGKLVDLLSRINGEIIEIPSLDLRTEHRDRRIDKVCVTVSLLRARFGRDLKVPRMLLRFIAHTTFRYSGRSIAHLIDMIDSRSLRNRQLQIDKLGLPMASDDALRESSLPLHFLDQDGGFGIVNRWKEFSTDKAFCQI